VKTNYKNVNEELNFQLYQEYEPRDNPTDHPNLGESSSSLPKCHHELSEIDVPIALRKAIRSCTKHSLSKYCHGQICLLPFLPPTVFTMVRSGGVDYNELQKV